VLSLQRVSGLFLNAFCGFAALDNIPYDLLLPALESLKRFLKFWAWPKSKLCLVVSFQILTGAIAAPASFVQKPGFRKVKMD